MFDCVELILKIFRESKVIFFTCGAGGVKCLLLCFVSFDGCEEP